jgi:hypothetical protein
MARWLALGLMGLRFGGQSKYVGRSRPEEIARHSDTGPFDQQPSPECNVNAQCSQNHPIRVGRSCCLGVLSIPAAQSAF